MKLTISYRHQLVGGDKRIGFVIMDGILCVAASKIEYYTKGQAEQAANFIIECVQRADNNSPQRAA